MKDNNSANTLEDMKAYIAAAEETVSDKTEPLVAQDAADTKSTSHLSDGTTSADDVKTDLETAQAPTTLCEGTADENETEDTLETVDTFETEAEAAQRYEASPSENIPSQNNIFWNVGDDLIAFTPAAAKDKKQFAAEKRAALKELNRLRKQIKRVKMPPTSAKASHIETGYYGETLPYPGGFPVYCCKYVIIADDAPVVAMRFFNASDILVTGVRFTLTEKDDKGRVIAVTELERTGLFAERGTSFAVADERVNAACVAAEIKVSAIISDEYEYVIGGDGEVTLKYGTESKTADLYFKERPSFKVRKHSRGYVFLSLLAVLLVAGVALLVAWQMGIFSRAYYDSSSDNASISTQINSGDSYVEA